MSFSIDVSAGNFKCFFTVPETTRALKIISNYKHDKFNIPYIFKIYIIWLYVFRTLYRGSSIEYKRDEIKPYTF